MTTTPDRIEAARRHLDSASRQYAVGHAYIAAVDLGLALEAIRDALVAIVQKANNR